jgi:hypothetical protein
MSFSSPDSKRIAAPGTTARLIFFQLQQDNCCAKSKAVAHCCGGAMGCSTPRRETRKANNR